MMSTTETAAAPATAPKSTRAERGLMNTTIANAKPRATVYRLKDGNNLYLEIRPTGSKIWRYRYMLEGRECIFTIGRHGDKADEVTLADARRARSEAADLVKQGLHPRAFKREQFNARVAANREVFAALAADFLADKAGNVSAHYFKQLEQAINRDMCPVIGETRVREVTTMQVREILMEHKGRPAWAKLLRRTVSEIYAYAAMHKRADNDPAYPLRAAIGQKGKLIKTGPVRNNPWLLLHEVPGFLTAVAEAPEEKRIEKIGIRILMLTMVRPNELAGALWSEFDLERGLWNVPAERMKMRRPHMVPLSRQAVAALRELHTITGDTPALFPERDARKRKAADGQALTKMPNLFARFIRSVGYMNRVTGHGLRATASTALNEAGVNRAWVEAQLAHKLPGVAGHYNHAVYAAQRAEMMQTWADMVLPTGTVVPLRKAA